MPMRSWWLGLMGGSVLVSGALVACLVETSAPEDAAVTTGVGAALTSPFASAMTDKIGVFRGGNWYLDRNGNGYWDGCQVDRCRNFGASGHFPVVGDWKGDGVTRIGVFVPSSNTWILDDGDGVYSSSKDTSFVYNPIGGTVTPVVYKGTQGSPSRPAVFKDGVWKISTQMPPNGTSDTANFGMAGDLPFTIRYAFGAGDYTKIGTFRPSAGQFYVDSNGSRAWNSGDAIWNLGLSTDKPLTGNFKVPPDPGFYPNESPGIFHSNASWLLDVDATRGDNGCNSDNCVADFGDPGDLPVVGNWPDSMSTVSGDKQVDVTTQPVNLTAYADWEITSAVIPPGHPNCASGRAFASGGVGALPRLISVDLTLLGAACNSAGCATDIWSSAIWTPLTNQGVLNSNNERVGSSDSQMAVNRNGDLFLFRLGTEGTEGSQNEHGVLYVFKSTDCGNTWTLASRLNSASASILGGKCGEYTQKYPGYDGHFGGWDRPEVYADPFNGNMYISVGCDHGNDAVNNNNRISEVVLFVSTDGGSTWTPHQHSSLEGFRPLVMTSTSGGRLFMLTGACFNGDYQNCHPIIIPVTVSGGNLTFENRFFPYYDGTFATAPSPTVPSDMRIHSWGEIPCWPTVMDRGGDGSLSISRVGRSGTADTVRVVYPTFTTSAGGTPRQVLRVMNVTYQGSGTNPTITPVTTIQPSSNGSAIMATTIDLTGPRGDAFGSLGVNRSLITWDETLGDGVPACVAPCCRDCKLVACDKCTPDASLPVCTPFDSTDIGSVYRKAALINGTTVAWLGTISRTTGGSLRSWGPMEHMLGDYYKGAFYGDTYLLHFFSVWLETAGTSSYTDIHTATVDVQPW